MQINIYVIIAVVVIIIILLIIFFKINAQDKKSLANDINAENTELDFKKDRNQKSQ